MSTRSAGTLLTEPYESDAKHEQLGSTSHDTGIMSSIAVWRLGKCG